jgi:two-component system response regulator DesR
LAAIESSPPNVILIDLMFPRKTAVKLVQGIRQRGIDTKVLLLVSNRDYRYLLDCIESGVHGCVLGDFSLAHLIEAIERAVQGDMFCSPEILEVLYQRLAGRRAKTPKLEDAARHRRQPS